MVGVPYLEVSDINSDGSLKSHVGNGKPVILMVYGSFCPHCKNAMPAYQEFASTTPSCVAATVQSDGDAEDKKAAQALAPVNKSQGVPAFLGFNSQGKFVNMHQGGRDAASLKAFAASL